MDTYERFTAEDFASVYTGPRDFVRKNDEGNPSLLFVYGENFAGSYDGWYLTIYNRTDIGIVKLAEFKLTPFPYLLPSGNVEYEMVKWLYQHVPGLVDDEDMMLVSKITEPTPFDEPDPFLTITEITADDVPNYLKHLA